MIINGQKIRVKEVPGWQSFRKMRARCYELKQKDYDKYGGIGVKVCDEWKTFQGFYNDMGERPTKDHTIDRLDNSKDYCKSNCRWATKTQQAHNRSHTLGITGVAGVRISSKDSNRFMAIIMHKNKKFSLGHFDTVEEASKVYQARKKELMNEPA